MIRLRLVTPARVHTHQWQNTGALLVAHLGKSLCAGCLTRHTLQVDENVGEVMIHSTCITNIVGFKSPLPDLSYKGMRLPDRRTAVVECA
jgi:hypothetical protein